MSVHNSKLETVTKQPYNAGTPLPVLLKERTPSHLTYVRNHFPRPELDVDTWRLQLEGAIIKPRAYSLTELQNLPTKTLCITLECAGNGRRGMNPHPKGTPWGYGAVSAFEVTGTSLSNVLDPVDLQESVVELSFRGADEGKVEPGRSAPYVRSLPREVSLHPDTMLVWAMNGEPLSPDHGFPLRLHVPGWYGMAAVKWLTEIRALTEPFEGFFQTQHYVYREETGTPDGEPVREMRVRSLIAQPKGEETLKIGETEIAGAAWSGMGDITQVEISTDAGASWEMAKLHTPGSTYAPMRWTYTWAPEIPGTYTLLSRATDSSGETQPLDQRWNRLGYGNNGVQAVEIKLT
jgi:DMSO/TMAO reductase YedYZ molybdopterin-dependent catalytic subunit